MGYTHYWKIKRAIPQTEFDKFIDGVTHILNETDIPLAGWEGSAGTRPQYTDGRLSFNGVESDSHESFVFTNEPTGSHFCKTAHKPYDSAVCAVLILAKKYFGKDIEISSDGDWDEWQGGRDLLIELVEDVVEEDIKCVFSGSDYSDNQFISAYI